MKRANEYIRTFFFHQLITAQSNLSMIEDIFYDLEFIQITSNDKSYYFIYKDMIYRIIADDDNASHFVMYYYSTP